MTGKCSGLMRCVMVLVAVGVAAAVVGCAEGVRADLRSEYVPDRLAGIREAADKQDRGAVPGLVESLQHSDVLVRIAAIGALDRLTGERLGYDPFASQAQRQPAVDAWVRFAGAMQAEAEP